MDSVMPPQFRQKQPNERLREPWVPKRANEIDPEEVKRLALIGCSNRTIANKLETTENTIRDHFDHETQWARAERQALLFAKQWEVAVVQGDKAMLIWLGKQEGQTDRQETTADYKTFEVIIGEPIQDNRLPSPAGSIEILEEQGPS